MVLDVVGSNPITHPIFFSAHSGVSPSGKARDFDSRIRWFESSHPSQSSPAPSGPGPTHDLLAQLVEHLTFNQGVRGSSPRWVTRHAALSGQLEKPLLWERFFGAWCPFANKGRLRLPLYIPWGNWLWGMGVGGSGAEASPFAPCGVWLANGKSEITGPTIVFAGLIRDLGWLVPSNASHLASGRSSSCARSGYRHTHLRLN